MVAPLRATVVCLLAAIGSLAAELPCDGGLSARGRTIREIRIDSPTLSDVTLPIAKDDVLTPDGLGRAQGAVRDRIRSTFAADFANRGGLQAIFIESCVVDAGSNQVDVVILPRAVYVPLSLSARGGFNTPQSGKAVLRSNRSGVTRVLNPEYGVSYDRELDASARVAFSTSVFELANVIAGKADSPRTSDLRVFADGSRSMQSQNYATWSGVAFEHRRPEAAIRVGLTSSFVSTRQPWGSGTRFENSVRNGFSIRLGRPPLLRGLGFAAAHRWATDRTNGSRATENAFELRSVFDYRLLGGSGRVSLLGDASKPEHAESYSRIAIRAGYSAEIPVARLKDEMGDLDAVHTLGVELQVAAGRSSAATPDYALFRGGGDAGRFVFDDSLDSQLARPFISGPVVRGYGKAQTEAADRYLSLGVNIAVPVPGWSKFLIPTSRDEDGVTIAQRIEVAGLNSSEVLMSSYYELEEGLPASEAEMKAKADIDSIRPAVLFLTRKAKIYSVRPLMMFDVAKIRPSPWSAAESERKYKSLYSAGVGLQFTIVTMRAEAGYAWNFASPDEQPAGNVIFRLSFQDIF